MYVGWWQWQQNGGDGGGDCARGDGDDGCQGLIGYGEGVCC